MHLTQHPARKERRPLAALAAALMAVFAIALAPATALAYDYTYESGSLGFFQWIGADEAVKVIEESPSNPIVGQYQNFTNMDSRTSAFNLDNMYRALDNIEYCNDLRVSHGSPESRIDPYLMAVSQINTNFSYVNYLTHSNAYDISENIAWGFANPYSRWYYDEKYEWESEELRPAREHMESLLAQGVMDYERARASALAYIRANYTNSSDLIYGGNGHYGILHYLNLIHPMWTYTGAASAAPSTNWWDGVDVYGIDEQTFHWTASSSKTYTVSEFRSLLDQYMDFINGDRLFFDVSEGDWFYDSVSWVVENEIMGGYAGTGNFGPNDGMQRAQVASVLYKRAGEPAVDLSVLDGYVDVGDDWYTNAVAWAIDNGIIVGDSGRFRPNDVATRQEFVTILWRLESEPQGNGNLYAYPDGHETSDWARDAMSWATGVSIINGNANTGEIDPTGNLNRAQAATIIMNWSNL